MKSFLLLILLLPHISHAQEPDQRTKIANDIMGIQQNPCSNPKLKSLFELAAIYINHGEYNNMKEQLLKAQNQSQNSACQQAIQHFLK